MQTKTCSTCKQTLSIENFHKGSRYKDGHRGQCKACTYKKTREYVQTDEGRKMARSATKKWRESNLDKAKESARKSYYERGGQQYHKQKRLTPEGQAIEKKASSKYRKAGKHRPHEIAYAQRNPEKKKAKNVVNNATKKGIIPRISTRTCAWCGEQAHQYHHESYDAERWLDVIPLCRKCHAKTYHHKNHV